MNSTQALTEARRRFGKAAGVSDLGAPCASTPAARAAAREEHQALRARLKELDDAHDKALARMRKLFPARMKERQDMTASHRQATKALRSEMEGAFSRSIRYRYKVGQLVAGLFFHIKGEGDSWEEAFIDVDHGEALDLNRYKKTETSQVRV